MLKPDFTPAFSRPIKLEELITEEETVLLFSAIGGKVMHRNYLVSKHVARSYCKLLVNGRL